MTSDDWGLSHADGRRLYAAIFGTSNSDGLLRKVDRLLDGLQANQTTLTSVSLKVGHLERELQLIERFHRDVYPDADVAKALWARIGQHLEDQERHEKRRSAFFGKVSETTARIGLGVLQTVMTAALLGWLVIQGVVVR